MSGRLKTAAFLLILVVGFYWKIALTNQYNWLWSPDLAAQVLPWFEVQARQWHRHSFPLWDQYLWGGQPLLGQAQPGGAYPLNWLLFLWPLDAAGHIRKAALDWYFLIIHFMAAAFCYKLCRELERSRTASLCAASIFAFAGYVGSTDWPQMVSGVVWTPLVFLFLLRAGAGKRLMANAAAAGACLGTAWLTGHHQAQMMMSLAFAGTWIYYLFREGRWNLRYLGPAVLSFAITGLCSALQTLPVWEYGHLANRWVGAVDSVTWKDPVPYYVHANFSLPPMALLGIVFPDMHTNIDPFVGVVALALALLAVAGFWTDWRVRLLSAIGLGGLAYSLGQFSFLQGLLYAITPSLDKARAPAVGSALFGFAVAVLAAFGFDRWRAEPDWLWVRRATKSALVFGLLIAATCSVLIIVNRETIPWDHRVLAVGLTSLLFALLLSASANRNISLRVAAVLLPALLLYELYQGAGYNFAPRDDANRNASAKAIEGNQDISDFLHGQTGIPRTQIPDTVFSPNWGQYHDVPVWSGYLASLTSNILSFDNSSNEAMLLWGVKYFVAPKASDYAQEDAFAAASGLHVYRQNGAFPRAWAVHKLIQVKTAEEGNQIMREHLPDLRAEAYMRQPPPPVPPCENPQDGVTLNEEQNTRVGITVMMTCPGMVVLSSIYYPGWRVNIDRKPAALYEVNGAMRGVIVPAGPHTITMRYRPFSVYFGAGLSLIGFLSAFLVYRRQV